MAKPRVNNRKNRGKIKSNRSPSSKRSRHPRSRNGHRKKSVQSSSSRRNDRNHFELAINSLGLPDQFPKKTIAAADRFKEIIPDDALTQFERRDLRSRLHVTIDGEDAKDFDDAVSACKEKAGYRIWISIADVALYVKASCPFDKEAAFRGTSVYLPTCVIPMLPEPLANNLCSLIPGQPRLTLTCEMIVDTNGNRSHISIYPSLIQSAARLTYTQVQSHMDGNQAALPESVADTVNDIILASKLLRQQRLQKGSLDLEVPEPEVTFDKSGNLVNIVARNPLPAHQVIEDLMIAANESVAEFLIEHRLSGVYRIHPPPPPEKWMVMAEWAKRFGLPIKTGKANNPLAVSHLLKQLKQSRQADTGQMLLLRSFSQAFYSSQVDHHFGLASEAYAHFTSPIRRYPDLLVHRALWNYWKNKPNLDDLEELAIRSSETERQAVNAERKIVHVAACLIACRRIGEEMTARIVGVHSAGLFVRPDDFYAEGLVPIRSLGEHDRDYFEVWPEAQAVVGRRTRTSYTLGDALSVRLANVDLEKNRINFELVPTPVHAKITQIGKSAPKTKQKKTKLRSTSKKRR